MADNNNSYQPKIVTPPQGKPNPVNNYNSQPNQPQQNNYQQTPATSQSYDTPNQYYDYNTSQQGGYYDYANPNQPAAPQDVTTPKKQDKRPFLKKITDFMVKKWWLVLILIVAIAVAGVAAFVLRPQEAPLSADYSNIEARIEAPQVVNSGSSGLWVVRVLNRNSVAINDVTVTLDFDRTFKFSQSLGEDPLNVRGTEYSLGSLGAIESGSSEGLIRIEGVLIGNIEESSVMTGTVSYTPAPLASQRSENIIQKTLDSASTLIKSPQVAIVMTPSNQSVQNGGEVSIDVEFENLSDKEIKDVRISMIYPDRGGFEYLDSKLQLSNSSDIRTDPDDGNNVWFVSSIPRIQKQNLKVNGILQGADGVRQTFRVEIAVKDAAGEYKVISQKTRDVTITSQPLIVTTSIRGKTPTSTFEPGEDLTFEVEYQNRSTVTLKSVEVIASVEDPADILDYSTLAYVGGSVGDINNRSIVWRANGVPELETVPPQSKGVLQYTAQVKEGDDFAKSDLSQNTYTLQPQAEAKATNQQVVQFTGDLYKATGELNLRQEIEEIPNSDRNSALRRFKVTWTLTNRQNKVNDVTLKTKTTFPPSIWQENSILPSSSSNEISYSSSNGEIIWKPGNIPSYTGISEPEKTITFEMEINNETRQNRDLFEDVLVTGIDDFTAESYTVDGKAGEIK